MDDVSPSTRLALHKDEDRRLRWVMVRRSPFLGGAVLLWFFADARVGSPLFFLVGLAALAVGASALGWWTHRRTDPFASTTEDRDAVLVEQAAIAERFAVRPAYVTYTLAGLLVAVGALQIILNGSVTRSIAAAGLVKPAVTAGQWWRLISATYLHANWFHLCGNVAALLVLGRYVETYSPRWRLPVVYVVAGIAGSIASVALLGKTSVGASGAILGLAGYLAAMGYRTPVSLPKAVRTSVFATIGLAAYFGAFGSAFIDNAAHFGGLVAGALLAWLMVPREGAAPAPPSVAPSQWNPIGTTAAMLIVVSAAGTVAVLARARPAAVSSAEASLSSATDPRAEPRSIVITNKSNRPIEAYRVTVTRDGQVVWMQWRDDCCFVGAGSEAPIAPHRTRRIGAMPPLIVLGLNPPTVRLDVVIFDDGSFEGDPEEFDKLIAQRRWAADSAAYWLKAIGDDRALPAKAFGLSLADRLNKRHQESPLESAAAEALGVPALISAAIAPMLQPARIDEARARIATAHQSLRARLNR